MEECNEAAWYSCHWELRTCDWLLAWTCDDWMCLAYFHYRFRVLCGCHVEYKRAKWQRPEHKRWNRIIEGIEFKFGLSFEFLFNSWKRLFHLISNNWLLKETWIGESKRMVVYSVKWCGMEYVFIELKYNWWCFRYDLQDLFQLRPYTSAAPDLVWSPKLTWRWQT